MIWCYLMSVDSSPYNWADTYWGILHSRQYNRRKYFASPIRPWKVSSLSRFYARDCQSDHLKFVALFACVMVVVVRWKSQDSYESASPRIKIACFFDSFTVLNSSDYPCMKHFPGDYRSIFSCCFLFQKATVSLLRSRISNVLLRLTTTMAPADSK